MAITKSAYACNFSDASKPLSDESCLPLADTILSTGSSDAVLSSDAYVEYFLSTVSLLQSTSWAI